MCFTTYQNLSRYIDIICNFAKRYIMATDYSNGYSGLAVADYFIEKAIGESKTITNMSVLKMIYFVQGFGFQILNRRLISDEFYAWQWGPVSKEVYYTFQKYGSSSISSPSNQKTKELEDIKKHSEITEILDKIYKLRGINPFVLSEKTHVPGGPWSRTEPYQKIDVDLIRNFFSQP